MAIIKNIRKNPGYVQVYNDVLEDKRLSWKAKGLLAYLTSKPENWTIVLDDLHKKSSDGFSSVRTAIKELKACGYMQVKPSVSSSNLFIGRELLVADYPLFWDKFRLLKNLNKPYKENEELTDENPIVKKKTSF